MNPAEVVRRLQATWAQLLADCVQATFDVGLDDQAVINTEIRACLPVRQDGER